MVETISPIDHTIVGANLCMGIISISVHHTQTLWSPFISLGVSAISVVFVACAVAVMQLIVLVLNANRQVRLFICDASVHVGAEGTALHDFESGIPRWRVQYFVSSEAGFTVMPSYFSGAQLPPLNQGIGSHAWTLDPGQGVSLDFIVTAHTWCTASSLFKNYER